VVALTSCRPFININIAGAKAWSLSGVHSCRSLGAVAMHSMTEECHARSGSPVSDRGMDQHVIISMHFDLICTEGHCWLVKCLNV